MNSEKPVYVGNAKEIFLSGRDSAGMKIELDIGQLRDFLNSPEADQVMRTWKDGRGVEHKTLPLVAWPLKPENVTDRRTHSVKVDAWKPDPARRRSAPQRDGHEGTRPVTPQPQTHAGEGAHDDDLPF